MFPQDEQAPPLPGIELLVRAEIGRIDGKVGSCMGDSRSFNADLPRVSKIENLFCASHFAEPKRARRWLLDLGAHRVDLVFGHIAQ
jgi:hypothetical protein